jgi:hypothetical protein
LGNTPNPVQSTSSNHAWSVARSFSVMPAIPFGINSRRYCVLLLPGPPSRVSSGAELPPFVGSCVRLKIESYPAFLIAPATFQKTSSPRKRSSHRAASSSLQACSRGCSRLPPTLMIHAFNFSRCSRQPRKSGAGQVSPSRAAAPAQASALLWAPVAFGRTLSSGRTLSDEQPHRYCA